MDKIFFDNWQSITRTLAITITAYPIMIFMLRVSGKRTLSQMNAFDFIITVALGSSLATVALDKNVTLVDGALVFFLLVFMQFVITWLSVRVKGVKKLVDSRPVLLLYKGRLLDEVTKKERITKDEIYLAARKKGISNLADIDVIILETTGELTVMKDVPDGSNQETLGDVITHGQLK